MILGFTGLKRCGKDTAASYILENYRAQQLMLAEPIKRGLMAMFGFTWEQVNGLDGYDREEIIPEYGVSIRHMLQTLGTDWGRIHIGNDVWVQATASDLDPNKLYVMSDVRFENEAELCRRNGVLIHVEATGAWKPEYDAHESENGVEFVAQDLKLPNSKDGLEKYYRELEGLITHIKEYKGWDIRSYQQYLTWMVHYVAASIDQTYYHRLNR